MLSELKQLPGLRNRATHSCHCCSAWQSMTPWRRCKPNSKMANSSLHSWTTLTLCVCHTAFAPSLTCWVPGCREWQGSSCTMARPGCGTKLVSVPNEWRSLVRTSGVHKASRSWAHPWVQETSWKEWRRNNWQKNKNCGKHWHGSQTCSARGKCFCNVQDPVATTSCEPVPPSQTGTYAVGHDRGMMQAMERLLGGFTGGGDQQVRARQIASLPMRLGGLGMRSTGRMSQAAYWASWGDALYMIHQRLPQLAGQFVTALSGVPLGAGCLGELQNAATSLDHQGFVTRPTWTELRLGKRPPVADCTEPGEWRTAGSSTRLPLLNTSSRRPWFLPSRVLPTRLTSGRILDRDQVTCSWDVPHDQSFRWNLGLSAPWCWKDCPCHLVSLARCVDVEPAWICWGASRCLSALRQAAHKSSARGKDIGQSVPRSRGLSQS